MTSPASTNDKSNIPNGETTFETWRNDLLETFLAELDLTTEYLHDHPDGHDFRDVSVVTYYIEQISCTGGWAEEREMVTTTQLCDIPGVDYLISVPNGEIVECHQEAVLLGVPKAAYTVFDVVDYFLSSSEREQFDKILKLLAGLCELREET